MDVLSQDLRVAPRRIQRAPALATAMVLTIGLGLGAAAAIFMTSDAALVEPLPYAEPQRLVHLWEVRAGTAERSPTSYPTLLGLAIACQELQRPRGLRPHQHHRRNGRRGAHAARRTSHRRLLPAPRRPDIGGARFPRRGCDDRRRSGHRERPLCPLRRRRHRAGPNRRHYSSLS